MRLVLAPFHSWTELWTRSTDEQYVRTWFYIATQWGLSFEKDMVITHSVVLCKGSPFTERTLINCTYNHCRGPGSFSRPSVYEKSVLSSRPERCAGALLLVKPPRVFGITVIRFLKPDLNSTMESLAGDLAARLVSCWSSCRAGSSPVMVKVPRNS